MAKNRKDKRTNNDLQNTTQKVTDRTTRALLKTDIIHLVINPIQVWTYNKGNNKITELRTIFQTDKISKQPENV
jgi:hypothetical protein